MALYKVKVNGMFGISTGREKVEKWLREFPKDIQAAVWHWYGDDALIIEPDSDLTEFRLQPAFCLRKLENRIRVLANGHGVTPSLRYVWLLENRENRGLDDFEAEAVFGQWLTVDLLYQHDRGAPLSRMLVCGRLREDIAGLSFFLNTPFAEDRVMASLDILESRGIPSTLFLGHEMVLSIISGVSSPILPRLRNLIGKKIVFPGLWVPEHRAESALNNMNAEIEPLRILVGKDCNIAMVRFASTVVLNPPYRLWRAMNNAGIPWDASLSAERDLPILREAVRKGPYLRGGAYISQAFDIKTPAGFDDPEGVRELVSFPLATGLAVSEPDGCREHIEKQWQKLWNWRCMRDDEKLAVLLDFRRMEEYFRHMDDSVSLSQLYHEYRVYNWPTPGPSPRITFVDGGALDNVQGVLAVVNRVRQATEETVCRWNLVDQTQLIEMSQAAITQRMAPLDALLKSQRNAHQYLQTISVAKPLRQDIEDFAGFLPASLGCALELGSGSGQLAMHLEARSSMYICSDLNPGIPDCFSGKKGRYGIVADVHNLPFDEAFFDSVIANNILEHLYDPLKALREVRRVLKPKGRLYALIPLDAMNSSHELRSHLWKADLEGIRNALDMAGLEPLRLETVDLYAMGIMGSFPTCNGQACKVEAAKPVKHGEC